MPVNKLSDKSGKILLIMVDRIKDHLRKTKQRNPVAAIRIQ
jgi:hypothetical protein